jgi:hypothetical protein
MALLLVNALSEDTAAAPGNTENNYICVSVIDAVGEPVTGLHKNNFKVHAMIMGPGGANVDIASCAPVGLPGCYVVRVVPILAETWKGGTYIFAISVERGADKGQNLASVLMD